LIETEHNQNGPAQIKPENRLSPHNVDMRRQEQFLQNIPKFKRILVPYVTSQMSDKALRYAIYLSKIFNSDIFILNVVENYEDLKYMLPATIRAEREADTERSTKSGLQRGDLKVSVEGVLRKVIEEKISLCNEAGLNTPITYEIRTGNPSDEIVKVAELTEFDLVVMASHRITSTIKSIGSITRKVMDTIRKPILLIHE
jgi:nucleotide-binding universal stress UspA family protein